MNLPQPAYIGDGVYVRPDQFGGVVLTTGNDLPQHADNVMFLEAQVRESLLAYIKTVMPAKEVTKND